MASDILKKRRARIRILRRRVVACSVALFLALWIVIFVQLASGHDPALTANADRRTTSTSVSTSSRPEQKRASETQTRTTTSSSDSSSQQVVVTSSATSSASAVTTQQS